MGVRHCHTNTPASGRKHRLVFVIIMRDITDRVVSFSPHSAPKISIFLGIYHEVLNSISLQIG